MAEAMQEIHEIHQQMRELALRRRCARDAGRAGRPAARPEPEPSPFNLPSCPRCASPPAARRRCKPPPVTRLLTP
jgi:hypothetical protein